MTKKEKRIAEIEAEYGQPIDDVLREFAREYSYKFTMQLLGSNPRTFNEYRYLFKRWAQPPREGSYKHVAQLNQSNAIRINGLTAQQIADRIGVTAHCVRQRIKRGLTTLEAIKNPPARKWQGKGNKAWGNFDFRNKGKQNDSIQKTN